ncbi:hypothetical protein [Neptunicella marina]|uniref:Peptidase M60 domain-containing protein n=1 Tax=Neptunicella marina TaxID=2125989 RepID=A0A8J6M365_9ALTE|nr:hypothetical protein [Neptunicella marina]MBC3767183.1 hypothetical protein [Neptunicella marina]
MYKSALFLLMTTLGLSGTAFANQVNTHIEKHNNGTWTVAYRTDEPVTQLSFNRSPNNARRTRWLPVSQDFEIAYQDEVESIQRKDGKTFNQVQFNLTATYIPLPKDYAPFSPFSDGGMLFHSGRFFVCIDKCEADNNSWSISVSAPNNQHIIVNGQVYAQQASWIDQDSGQKVYVGDALPIADKHFVSIIDQQLPQQLSDDIKNQLPGLMDFYSQKLGELDFRPSLYASYHDSSNGGYGHQGGTLPGQVFMHWYGKPAIENLNTDATYWFFAHELGHIFQRDAQYIENPQQAWIHEGAAEFFAGQAARADYFNKKLIQARQDCLAGLKDNHNYLAASANNFRLHYSCGLVLINTINQQLTEQTNMDMFMIWRDFNKKVAHGDKAGADTFLSSLKAHLPADYFTQLQQFASSTEFNAYDFFQ